MENFSIYTTTAFFLLSLVLVLGLTPWVIKLANKFKVVSVPDSRRKHSRVTPLMGGIAVYFSLMVITLFGFYLTHDFYFRKHLTYFFISSAMIFALGIWDDVRHLKAIPKFLFELFVISVFLYGIQDLITDIGFSFFVNFLVFFCVGFFILAATNAMNLIDGMDGLCSGNALISGASLVIISFLSMQELTFASLLGPAISGACLGFLYYNKNPAKIFLGDSGSLTLGFFLSSLGIELGLRSESSLAMIIPALVLGLPLLDVAVVVSIRIRNNHPVFLGDRNHLHHRLLKLGLSVQKVLIILLFVSVYFNLLALQLIASPEVRIFALTFSGLIVIFLGLTLLRYAESKLHQEKAKLTKSFDDIFDNSSLSLKRNTEDDSIHVQLPMSAKYSEKSNSLKTPFSSHPYRG